MTKPKRPVLQVAMTETQMDLMDFLLDIIHHGRYSKTSFVLECIRDHVRGYLSLPDDIGLNDEQLLEMAIDENERRIISVIGKDKYDEFWKQQKDGEKDE